MHQAVVSDDHYQSGDIDTDQNVEYKGLDDTLRPSIDRTSAQILNTTKRNLQAKKLPRKALMLGHFMYMVLNFF